MPERIFIPGSNWLYFKLYTGHKSADEILLNRILPFVTALIDSNVISKFFFIRYGDPDFHIRLRLYIPDTNDYGKVFPAFFNIFKPCIDNGLLSKISCDTYVQELERYGESTMDIVEDCFYIDSYYILLLLKEFESTSDINTEQERWKCAIRLLDDMLSAFGLNTMDKLNTVGDYALSYKTEFGFLHNHLTKQLNDKYRVNKTVIENLFISKHYTNPVNDLLNDRYARLTLKAGEIEPFTQTDADTSMILLKSLMHMCMNRLFRSKNRLNELVLYDHLSKYYKSVIAREKYNNGEKVSSL